MFTIKLYVIVLGKNSKNTVIKIVNLPGNFPVINRCGKEGKEFGV